MKRKGHYSGFLGILIQQCPPSYLSHAPFWPLLPPDPSPTPFPDHTPLIKPMQWVWRWSWNIKRCSSRTQNILKDRTCNGRIPARLFHFLFRDNRWLNSWVSAYIYIFILSLGASNICRMQCCGSGSVSQRYGSGSFHHQAKRVRKTLIPTSLWLFIFKNYVNVPSNSKAKNWEKQIFLMPYSWSLT